MTSQTLLVPFLGLSWELSIGTKTPIESRKPIEMETQGTEWNIRRTESDALLEKSPQIQHFVSVE